jgi:hypothetical protein
MTKFLSACCLAMIVGFAGPASAQEKQAFKLVQTIPLPGVRGRLDHMGVDLEKKRLFVAASDNNTLEVVDLTGGKVTKSLTGFKDTQDALFLGGNFNKLYVSSLDGHVRVFQGESFWLVQDSRSSPMRIAFSMTLRPASSTSVTAARMQDSMHMAALVSCSRSPARDMTSLSRT